MKILLLFCFLSPIVLFAQISITDADFAEADESVIMSITTDNSIDFVTTGVNHTWDFSNLTLETQRFRGFMGMSGVPTFVYAAFVATVLTDYQASYYLPATDLPLNDISGFLPISITDVNQYTRKTSNAITSIGYSLNIEGNTIPVRSDTIETRYKFPMYYGDSYSSRGYTNLDMNPFFDAIFRQYRQRYTEVDGWGNITTPYGSFDALRVKHTINEIDSIRIDVFGNLTWIPIPVPDSYIYEWLANGEDDAILRITTTDILGTETVTGIEYKDYGLGLNELVLEVELYPNPASGLISIKNAPLGSSFSIVDMSGSLVMEGVIKTPLAQVNIATLDNGMYEFIVKDAHQISRKSFIKQD